METWKPLRNFPSYNGSSEGRIINVRTQKILKPWINKKGYAQVCLFKNKRPYTVSVHRVLADTFLGEQPNLDVRHKDGDRLNNRPDNLEWKITSISIRVIETGEIYESIRACARAVGCDHRDIQRYLSGKRISVKGYHFERV